MSTHPNPANSVIGYTGSCLWSTVAKTHHSMWIFNIQIEYWNGISFFCSLHRIVHKNGIKMECGKNQSFLQLTLNCYRPTYTLHRGGRFTFLRHLLLFYVQPTSVKKPETAPVVYYNMWISIHTSLLYVSWKRYVSPFSIFVLSLVMFAQNLQVGKNSPYDWINAH